MRGYWDLFVINPIFIVAGIGVMAFIVVRERTSLKWISYFFATLTFWITTAIILKMNLLQLENVFNTRYFNTSVLIMLLFLGAPMLLSTIFQPLATWLTGRVNWRKWWLLLGLIGLSFAWIFTIINQTQNLAVFYVFTGLSLAVALSTSSIFCLSFNEQFYYRIAPVLSTTVMSTVICFATFFGNYIVDLESVVFPLKPENYLVLSLILSFIGIVIFGVMLTFSPEEDKAYVRSFELNQIRQFPKYSSGRLAYMMVAMFFFGAFFGFTQSTLVLDYLQSLFYVKISHYQPGIDATVRAFRQLYLAPQFLFGYLFYKQITLKFGFKPTIIGLLSLTVLSILFICFLDLPYVYIVFNFVLGLTFHQIFYSFFSMAIMWNYRAKNVPVTGLVSGSVVLGISLVELIIQLVKVNNAGVYDATIFADPVAFQKAVSPVVVIVYSVVGAFCILAIVVFFFSMKVVFADYLVLGAANQNAKTMLRNSQRQKARNRILVNEVKITE